jgi:hypothetical protein
MDEAVRLPDVVEQLRPLIEALPFAIQPRLLARLERGAAERYGAWAAACADAPRAEGLRACAAREEEIAARAERIFPAQPEEEQQMSTVLPEIAKLYRAALAQRPVLDQYAIQAAAERRGAALWRGFASTHPDAAVRAALLACATLEERSAAFLEAVIKGDA